MRAATDTLRRTRLFGLAALACLAMLPDRAWAAPLPEKPVTIGIAAITPAAGKNARAEEKLPRLESGGYELQCALFRAWGRRTNKKIIFTLAGEGANALAEEELKANVGAPGSPSPRALKLAAAEYIVQTTYVVVRNRAKTTATLAHRAVGGAVASVDSNIDPDEEMAFNEIAEKLADAIAKDLKMPVEVPSYRLVFCPFETTGRPESAEQWLVPAAMRQLIKSVFGRRGLYHVTVDSDELDCPDPASRRASPANPGGGPVVLYVRETIVFVGASQIMIQLSFGTASALRMCNQEKDLAQPIVIEDLTEQLWSSLNKKLAE